MENYLNIVKKKITNSIDVEDITIVDNSSKHKTHKFFDKDKYHIQLNIKSSYLCKMSRIEAQKMIMKILSDDLKNKIHALEINIT